VASLASSGNCLDRREPAFQGGALLDDDRDQVDAQRSMVKAIAFQVWLQVLGKTQSTRM
jgi:hypothetical protein